MKILFFGQLDMAINKKANLCCQTWQKQGHEVIRIAIDIHPLVNQDYEFDDQITNLYPEADLQQWKVAPLLKLFLDKYHPDIVIQFQGNHEDITLDCRDCTTPLFYYHTEPIFPRLPINCDNLKGIFWAYYGGWDYLRHAHTYYCLRCFEYFLPYGFHPALYTPRPPDYDIKYDVGFQGDGWGDYVHPDIKRFPHNWILQHLRDSRDRFVKYIRDKHHAFVRPNLSLQNYIAFLHDTKIVMNVPSELNCVNERQYHTLAAGAILLQMDYEGLDKLGFKDKENCLIFKNEKDIDDQLQWAKDHPQELEQIRLNGIEFAKIHSYQQRAMEMLDVIQKKGYGDASKS